MARWAKSHNIPLRPRGGASHDQVRLTRAQAATAPRILRPALVGEGAWERLTRFAAASRYRTITEAAHALGLNQPTLTTQRPLQLTPLGRRVITAVARHTRSKSNVTNQETNRARQPPRKERPGPRVSGEPGGVPPA